MIFLFCRIISKFSRREFQRAVTREKTGMYFLKSPVVAFNAVLQIFTSFCDATPF